MDKQDNFFLSYHIFVNQLTETVIYTKKFLIMFSMTLPASLIFLDRDLLLKDTAASNSALIE